MLKCLQNATDALSSYIFIGIVWTIGSIAVLYSSYGVKGGIIEFIANFIMMRWIVLSYLHSFKKASQKFNIPFSRLFKNF